MQALPPPDVQRQCGCSLGSVMAEPVKGTQAARISGAICSSVRVKTGGSSVCVQRMRSVLLAWPQVICSASKVVWPGTDWK